VVIIAIDLNFIGIAIAHNGPITAADLAEKSKADIELIRKLFSSQLPQSIMLIFAMPHSSAARP
jgi:hypothetical protein